MQGSYDDLSPRSALKGYAVPLLLAILKQGSQHGYGLVAELARRSDNVLRLSQGTVYPLLHDLEARGLVISDWDTQGRQKRRLYRITDEGTAELERRLEALRAANRLFRQITGSDAAEDAPRPD